MTNSDWWDRAKTPPQPERSRVRPRELLATLREGEHAMTLEKRIVSQIGEELILSVDREWRRMRVLRSESLLSATLLTTIARIEARGWSRK